MLKKILSWWIESVIAILWIAFIWCAMSSSCRNYNQNYNQNYHQSNWYYQNQNYNWSYYQNNWYNWSYYQQSRPLSNKQRRYISSLNQIWLRLLDWQWREVNVWYYNDWYNDQFMEKHVSYIASLERLWFTVVDWNWNIVR